jgi:polygalacturonase
LGTFTTGTKLYKPSVGETGWGTAVDANFDLLSQEVVNVKSYGALGDNSTNDAVAIQAAIDAGGRVFFPAGTYIVGATLNIKTNVTLAGTGMGTVLKAANSLNANLISTTGASQIFFAGIRDMRLDGNKANNTSGITLLLRQAHTWYVRGVHIKDSADVGLKLQGTDANTTTLNCWIRDCRIENTVNQAMFIDGFAPNNHVSGCIIGGTTNFDGIECTNDEELIVGCHIHTAARHGINMNGGDNCIVEGNYIESSNQHGINIASTSIGTRCIGNVCFNNGLTGTGDGINIAGTDSTISGNRCFDRQGTKTQDYAIQLTAASARNLVLGNSARSTENQTGAINDLGTGNTLANNQTT